MLPFVLLYITLYTTTIALVTWPACKLMFFISKASSTLLTHLRLVVVPNRLLRRHRVHDVVDRAHSALGPQRQVHCAALRAHPAGAVSAAGHPRLGARGRRHRLRRAVVSCCANRRLCALSPVARTRNMIMKRQLVSGRSRRVLPSALTCSVSMLRFGTYVRDRDADSCTSGMWAAYDYARHGCTVRPSCSIAPPTSFDFPCLFPGSPLLPLRRACLMGCVRALSSALRISVTGVGTLRSVRALYSCGSSVTTPPGRGSNKECLACFR